MGRDHTIYATEAGYVKYYKDPERHPKRQYIGVTFKRDDVLPLPRNAMRRRRLGMILQQVGVDGEGTLQAQVAVLEGEAAAEDVAEVQKPVRRVKERKGEEGRNLQLRPGYMYRKGNWEIGRAAERAKVKVKEFKPRDRWAAWRKTTARKAKAAERRGLSRKAGKR
jgi:hypothetical protein